MPEVGTRICVTCGIEKPIIKFSKYRNNHQQGRRRTCRDCRYKKEKTRPGFQERAKFYQIEIAYGLTRTDYEALLLRQGGNCGLCQRPPSGTGWCVDHDHACCSGLKSCGKCVRAIVCRQCNCILAFLENDNRLQKVINYIGAKH